MQPRRQHLIDTAYRLFNEHGYHATGIDWILAESGVSKATLYKHFRSKEALILAVLEQRHEQLMALLESAIAEAGERGEQPVLAIFDVLDAWFATEGFFGCNFIKASGEYAATGDAIHRFAARHKADVERLIHDNLPEDPDGSLAAALALLVDGAIVYAHTRGDRGAARLARKMAEQILANSQPRTVARKGRS